MALSHEPAERDYDTLVDTYADEKAADPYLARQRRVWVMLAESGKMCLSAGALEGRSDDMDTLR
jgi:hypothetical protein